VPAGETGIFESYVRALAIATDFVYVENQYFTCVELVDALVAAMLRQPKLQLIALINMKLDIPGYAAWQREAVERLLVGLGDQANRAGVFTLWSHEKADSADGRSVLLRTYVHSKLAIIDDAWLTLGSANLDGVSLLAGEHFRRWPIAGRIGRLFRLFGDGDPKVARSTEVNVTCAGVPGTLPPAEIGRLRRELWAEHLGYGLSPDSAEAAPIQRRPTGGWLSLWQERAQQKLLGMRAADPIVTAPRILPYPAIGGRVPAGIDRPEAYLRSLGIGSDRIDVRAQFRSFSLQDGRWR
jgi:hypothetical protein